MNEEKNKNVKVENKEVKPTKKRKKRKLKLGYILALIIIVIAIIFIIKLVLPSGTSKYGNRLDGIEKITFGEKEQKAIVDNLKGNEKVTEAKVDVKGRIVYIIFNLRNDSTVQDGKDIAGNSLGAISNEVKGYYDINFVVSKNDEEGVKETKEDGTEVTKKEFPIMGYKNRKNDGIVW